MMIAMPLLSLILERDGINATWIGFKAAIASLAVLAAAGWCGWTRKRSRERGIFAALL